MVKGEADYPSRVAMLAELCPIFCFPINGQNPYTSTPVNIMKMLKSLNIL